MRILTPGGYVDAAACQVGQAVLAIDPATGERLTNFVEEVEVMPRPNRLPWQGLRFGKHKERWKQDWERWTARRDGFAWVRVNGDNLFFAEQSVWANDNVTHAKLLKAGDAIYDAEDNLIVVRDVEIDAEGPDEWIRFKISGDHSYVGDDVTLHNASRFWVLGTANWDASTTTNWAAISGGPGGSSVPTSSDDVSFDVLSNGAGGSYTVTVTATANCKDMTWALPAVSGVPTITGGSALNIFGSLTFVSGQLVSVSGGGINFPATTTGKTITTAGVTIDGSWNFNGSGGGWTLQDNITFASSRSLTVTNGTFNSNAKTITAGFFTSTSGTRTLTLDSSVINITGTSGSPWNVQTIGALTFSATGSTINFNGGGAGVNLTITWGTGLTYGSVNITGAGLWTYSQSATFKNFSYTSTTNKTDTLISGAVTTTISASGSLTLTGNSVVNRAFVRVQTLGIQGSFSVPNTATVTLTNVDFQDIASAGTFGTWTGTSLGDALGNSGITFDPSVSLTLASTGTINWSSATWTSSGAARTAPLPQDDVDLSNSSTATTLTADMPRLGRNITAANYLKTLNSSITNTLFGNLTLGSGMSQSLAQINLQGRGSQTITNNGINFTSTVIIQAVSGSYTLQDAFLSLSLLNFSSGTLECNGKNLSVLSFTSNSGATRTINAAGTTWTISSASGTPWNLASAGLTFNAPAMIKLTGNVTVTLTFAGGGLTYNNFWWSNTAATGTLIITGANTFNDFKINRTTARGIRFPAATTTTIASWTDESLGTAVLTIDSSSAGSAATLSKPGGDVRTDYCSIKDSTATGGANWRAGPHSTSVSNNSGWIFGNVDYPVAGILTGAAAVAAAAAQDSKPSASLVCSTIIAGNIWSAAVASETLSASDSFSGVAFGAISAADSLGAAAGIDQLIREFVGDGELGAVASLGGAAASGYSVGGNLDVSAEIDGRAIFQAESMTVEVLPSGATTEVLPSGTTVGVLPSSATVTQRQRARS